MNREGSKIMLLLDLDDTDDEEFIHMYDTFKKRKRDEDNMMPWTLLTIIAIFILYLY